MAEALYRKYRPQVFEDVVGQEPIERTLKNAIAHDKVSHAYLFCGPRGTGKTTTARLLAKALLCQQGPTPDPDGTCEDCELIAEGAHPDVYELDAASRTGVENVREEIISRVHFAPTRGRYKVYIVDEVHMLSTAAFNALLKTLEEPPSHVVFILCTTDPQKVPETIHSRCQRFDFHRIAPESMVARLGAICMAEDVEFEGEALDLIAQRADGGLRNALTSLEQIIAFENGKVTLAGAERLLGSIDSNDLAEIMAYVGKRDIANCFLWISRYVETGADLAQFARDMAEHVRNLYLMALVGDDVELEVSEITRRQLVGELSWFGPERASRLLGVLGDLMAELKTTSNPRLAFEVALTRMVRPDSDLTLESLAERVEALESGYSAVAHVLPGGPYAAPAAAGAQGGPAGSSADRAAESDPLGQDAASPSGEGSLEPAPATGAEGLRSETARPSLRAFDSEAAVPQVEGGSSGPAASSAEVGDQPVAAQPAEEQPSPSSPAASSDSKLAALANPASLQRIWQAALSAVKRKKQSHGVLFMNTKVRFDEAAGMVRIVFSPDNTFAFNAVQKPDAQAALEEALEKAAGTRVPFCFEQAGSEQAAVARVAAAPARQDRPGAQPQTQSQARPEPQAQPEPEPQAQSQPEPQAQPQPVAQPQPEPQPVAQQQPEAQPEPSAQAAPQPQPGSPQVQHPQPEPQAPDPDYDAVPYDDYVYDPVPYDDYAYEPAPYEAPVPSGGPVPQGGPDASTGASPDGPNVGPDGAAREDPSAVEALLQASFGAGVVLSEADE